MGKKGRKGGGSPAARVDPHKANRIHKSKKKLQQQQQQQQGKAKGGGHRHSPSSSSSAVAGNGGHGYAKDQRVLLLGEGDFSFAAALALLWQDASNLTATAFDDEASCATKYRGLADNVSTIRSLGGTVLFGVDACKSHTHKTVAKRAPFERIIFNFPHTGTGIKDQARNVASNQALLRGTFSSCLTGGLLAPGGKGELHMTLKKGPPYDSWQPVVIAKMCGLAVRHCAPFRPERFPGYAHRRSIGDDHAGGAQQHVANAEISGARTYCFVPR